jgi:SAM-dependent methyltransferase
VSFPDYRDFWEGRYRGAGDDYLFGTAPNRFLESRSALFSPDMAVLSVADGEGRNSVWMAEQGCRVTATEISRTALERARKLAHGRHVTVDFLEADIFHWTWPEASYDAVVGIFIQFAGPVERARLFAGMKQAVRPGGRVLLQGYTPKQLEYRTGGPSAVENLYTVELLRDAFADWEIEHLHEYDEMIAEGAGHAGLSALIDLVARRPRGK